MPEKLRWLAAQLHDHQARLRHRPAASGKPGPDAPAALPRALIAVRLLLHRSDQDNLPALSTWLEALQSFLEWLHDHPSRCPAALNQAIEQLAALQQQALGRLDAGEELTSVLAVDDLESVQRDLIGSTAVVDRLPANDRRRHQHAAPRTGGAGRDRLLLLVGGHFRAGCLCRILAAAGLTAVTCPHPSEALALLRSGERFRAVLCDNVEPTAHLQALQRLARRHKWRLAVPLVLVSAASRPHVLQHARRLGAVGVWQPPYPIDNLRELLAMPPPHRS